MLHMERVGIRELRQRASAILRRVAAGENFEVTDRGRVVAVLLRARHPGMGRLREEGMLRPAEGELLEIETIALPPGADPPSRVISEGRQE
jgi:prevent-host-death family protein